MSEEMNIIKEEQLNTFKQLYDEKLANLDVEDLKNVHKGNETQINALITEGKIKEGDIVIMVL